MKRLLLALCGLGIVSCVDPGRATGVPAGSGPVIVVYKASVDEGQGARRGVKLAVWTERPDRLHAELIAPVGGVSYILDAGGGKVCLVDVGNATAYVGDDGPDAIAMLTGVRVTVAEAIAALLDGVSPEGLIVSRLGGADGGLPERFRIEDRGRSLALERVRVERGRTATQELGTGRPPATLRVRPLADLARDRAGPPGDGGGAP